ncbi:PTS sugar transporter subunit IIA [Lederbergia citrea]|uniref:PTS glucose transporter subunit IIA n=1 Tax=Lederbergia citrea TaxID=2833581 RepID=A0A942UMQ8_9BACI|nr:PTS glucose transporter subunit IIA [Lederbergia citrea]MBS4176646.1 PTS glucose transporter subunit IIA [Lederbergia citrea]MBS4203207.1 PTS glucose transporter subunit IIA [Lederbergia citrea]MBS4222122.1 PTS glucose transporter subunit IIA [Lederbergia citrea]
MLKKLFGKKEVAPKTITINSPLTGTLTSLEEVPDPVFSQKMMGDGMAVKPETGTVVSPVDGDIIQVFPTKHAIGIKAKNGAELLIHIGLETVGMKGEGFTAYVKEGDKVKTGDKLVDFDMGLVTEKAASTITPIIITNGDDAASINKHQTGSVTAGESPIMEITMK